MQWSLCPCSKHQPQLKNTEPEVGHLSRNRSYRQACCYTTLRTKPSYLKGSLPLTLHRCLYRRIYILCVPEHNFPQPYLSTAYSVVIISRVASGLQVFLTCFIFFSDFLHFLNIIKQVQNITHKNI